MPIPLSEASANGLLDDFGARLDNGTLAIYAGTSSSLSGALVALPLGIPAFRPAIDGRLIAHDIPPAVIGKSGRATTAHLLTQTGELVTVLPVRRDSDAVVGAVLVDRTDFQQGGLCTVSQLILTVPVQS